MSESAVITATGRRKTAIARIRMQPGDGKITINGRHYQGKGVSTDIIEAAAHAYLKALNKADHDRRTATETATLKLSQQP